MMAIMHLLIPHAHHVRQVFCPIGWHRVLIHGLPGCVRNYLAP